MNFNESAYMHMLLEICDGKANGVYSDITKLNYTKHKTGRQTAYNPYQRLGAALLF